MLDNEILIRLGCFVTLLALLIVLQAYWPRCQNPAQTGKKIKRWSANFVMVFTATLLVRIVLPLSATAFALWVTEHDLAAFGVTLWTIPAIILLDLLIYWQHRLSHEVPFLWRLHKMHHSDNWLDVSSALRFHPLEILLSMLLKFIAIWLFGISALAVMWFEVILNSTALFNHSNIRLPADRWLRLFIVTPDMHRVHHSVDVAETNSNYGFNIPWWDRWFGTYIAQPRVGHTQLNIGLDDYPQGETSWQQLLLMPFMKPRRKAALTPAATATTLRKVSADD